MVRTKHECGVTLWKPRSFTGLMALYESNHLRLKRLLGGAIPEPGDQFVSYSPLDLALHLECAERSRYTTTLRMTYYFEWTADPDMLIRVYHDASLAEAMHCGGHARHRVLRPFITDSGTELQRRWARNLMLNKWLEYCHERGHRFGVTETPCVEPVQIGLR